MTQKGILQSNLTYVVKVSRISGINIAIQTVLYQLVKQSGTLIQTISHILKIPLKWELLVMLQKLNLTEQIRRMARDVEGIEDAHEIIVHDYGAKYLISLHVEIPEEYGSVRMHDIAESCEEKLRNAYSGEAVCHTDPLAEKSEEVQAVENTFKEIVAECDEVVDYHDFRVIADSAEKIIVAADIDAAEEVAPSQYEALAKELEKRTQEQISNVAYCSFYITPKFAY